MRYGKIRKFHCSHDLGCSSHRAFRRAGCGQCFQEESSCSVFLGKCADRHLTDIIMSYSVKSYTPLFVLTIHCHSPVTRYQLLSVQVKPHRLHHSPFVHPAPSSRFRSNLIRLLGRSIPPFLLLPSGSFLLPQARSRSVSVQTQAKITRFACLVVAY